jgi:hypothetical protein
MGTSNNFAPSFVIRSNVSSPSETKTNSEFRTSNRFISSSMVWGSAGALSTNGNAHPQDLDQPNISKERCRRLFHRIGRFTSDTNLTRLVLSCHGCDEQDPVIKVNNGDILVSFVAFIAVETLANGFDKAHDIGYDSTRIAPLTCEPGGLAGNLDECSLSMQP